MSDKERIDKLIERVEKLEDTVNKVIKWQLDTIEKLNAVGASMESHTN